MLLLRCDGFYRVFAFAYSYLLQLTDFLRFGVKFVEELYTQQPPKNTAGSWKYVVYIFDI